VIGVLDEFIRCDFDGDGVAELRRVIRAGDTILFNEAVDDNAFALLCPCPMPHKVYGRSTADQAVEGQKVRSAILRQTLDNLYKTNNPRPIVADNAINEATMDDLGDSSPGAVIRTKTIGQLDWATVPFTAGHSFNMLEFVALGVEEQTGVQRKGNGFNAEALRKNWPATATQAAIDENSRNERAEMVARIFAETGVKRLFKLVLKLLVAHQPQARLIRLRGQWVGIDPRGWNPDMDLTISVGLGVGNKSELLGQADDVLASMAALQATPYAWLVDAKKVHAALKRKFVAAGIRNVDDYLVDPARAEPPAPQKSAEEMRVEAEMEACEAELRLKQAEAAARIELERTKAAAQAELERLRAQFEAELAERKAAREFELAKMRLGREGQGEATPRQADEAALDENRPGGKLDE